MGTAAWVLRAIIGNTQMAEKHCLDGGRVRPSASFTCFHTQASFPKGPDTAYNKNINNDFIKLNYQTLKKRKCKYANYKGQECYSEFSGKEAKKEKRNWWFYQNRNARSQGTKISVGIKYKKKAFTQSFIEGVIKNKMDKCSSSFHMADSYTYLQSKLNTEPHMSQSCKYSSTRK